MKRTAGYLNHRIKNLIAVKNNIVECNRTINEYNRMIIEHNRILIEQSNVIEFSKVFMILINLITIRLIQLIEYQSFNCVQLYSINLVIKKFN